MKLERAATPPTPANVTWLRDHFQKARIRREREAARTLQAGASGDSAAAGDANDGDDTMLQARRRTTAELMQGHSNVARAVLAEEMHVRLFRYGIGINALTDPYMARMTAATLGQSDVLIAISASGRTREVVEAVELARHYGAHTIAITTPDGELAAASELTLGARIPEYPDTLTPSAFRFGYLAIIDLLSAAVGYRLSTDAREKLRRIRYTVLARRNETAMEPLGD